MKAACIFDYLYLRVTLIVQQNIKSEFSSQNPTF